MHRIIGFQRRLVESGAFTNPRSHIYYLPELYCAYFGRCYAAFIALPPAARQAIDPEDTFDFIRGRVLVYVQRELIAHEMNAFDAALALMALAHLGAEPSSFTPALACIVAHVGEGGRHGPSRAYEWNKMKTPTRILVGGPEVTSAFVLMGLALARRRDDERRMASSEWRMAIEQPPSLFALATRHSAIRRNDGKLKAMRPQSTGKPAALSAQSAQLLCMFPRRDRR